MLTYDVSVLTFIENPSDIREGDDVWIAQIPSDIRDQQNLFSILAKQLKFPEYFGKNWDALNDLLCDLSWISSKKVILLHEELPIELGEDIMRTYLEALIDCIQDWRSGGEHELAAVFPTTSREIVKKILASHGT